MNGEIQDIQRLMDNTLIGFDIPRAGYYEIELKFRKPGSVPGIVISCLSMHIFMPIIIEKELNLKKN